MEHGGPSLRRVVSRWQIVGLALNDVIGSGVYLLPAAAAAMLGPASLWAVPVAGFAVLLVVLCFAEAATHFDEPGSAYLYAKTAFGDLAGLEVGWMTWLARVASIASLSVGFAEALGYLWPALDGGWPRALVIASPIVGLSLINIVGVRSAVNAAVFLVVSKLVPLIVFVGVGLFHAKWSVVTTQPPGDGRLGAAALLLLFAFAGFENTSAAAGEFRKPRRDIPFALLLHIAVITLLYVAVQWVALGTLPGLATSETPLADAANLFLGPAAGLLLTIGAAMSILGTNSNTVLNGPRYLLALSRDGYGPEILGRIHPRFRTPVNAVVFQALIALPLALTGSFVALAELSVVARLVTYLGTTVAIPVLRRTLDETPGAFRIPGGALVPVAASLVTLALAASAQTSNLVSAAIALGVGYAIHASRRRPARR
jgi:APA family basic amino acid/polyamine antiporter